MVAAGTAARGRQRPPEQIFNAFFHKSSLIKPFCVIGTVIGESYSEFGETLKTLRPFDSPTLYSYEYSYPSTVGILLRVQERVGTVPVLYYCTVLVQYRITERWKSQKRGTRTVL